MPDPVAPEHLYHAEATALSGMLTMPLKQTIDPQATATLHPKGGYLSQKTGEFRLEAVVGFKSAHTQVSGIRGVKEGHGHATLTTAVVEGLNILEILTCDRIVSQIATEHPLEGHTPEITFLGTRFENLRIAGHPVHVKLDIDRVGPKPTNDLHYLHEPGFLGRVSKQCQSVRDYSGLPQAARERYTGVSTVTPNGNADQHSIDFSLVTEISGDFPGKAFGHVIHVPHFGTIYLATVKITCDDDKKTPPKTTVELTMLEVKMGCIGHGDVNVGSAKTNGGGKGG
jgi:hypothetical protein